MRCLLVEVSADVDVGCGGVHPASGDEAAFDEFVGVTSEDFAVFASVCFPFVGIHDEVTVMSGGNELFMINVYSPKILLLTRLVHEIPLETTWKTGTASSTKTRVFDRLDNPRVALE